MDKQQGVISAKELRQKYNVGSTTWWKWLRSLRDIIPPHTHILDPKMQKAIYDKYGEP